MKPPRPARRRARVIAQSFSEPRPLDPIALSLAVWLGVAVLFAAAARVPALPPEAASDATAQFVSGFVGY